MALATSPSPSPFAVFKRRNFTLMWTGQLVSTIGGALTSLAASILVYRETGGSALAVGLMLMATAAPTLLVGLVAGVYVDRFNRKRIMIVADLLRAGLVLLIPFLAPYGLVWLYVIVALASAIGQFYDPAYEAVLPEVAPDEELGAANSMMAISSFGSTAIGFAASGLIAANYPIEYAFYIDSITFLFSVLCISLLRVPKLEVGDSTTVRVVADNLKTGIAYLLKSPMLRSLFLLAAPVSVAMGMENSLLLPFSDKALGANEFQYGVQEGVTSLGFVAGSLLMAGLVNRWREGQWIVVGLTGMGIMTVVYSQTSSIPLAIAFQAASGFLNAPFVIARRLVVQRNTAAELRGRVNSAYYVSTDVFFLIGMAVAGLADVIDVRFLFMLSGLVIGGAGLWALVLPGLGQPAAEWRRALALLRSASAAGVLGQGRAVMPADVDLLVGLVPSLSELARPERERLMTQGRVYEAEPGMRLMTAGETGDSVYFILSGKAVAGINAGQGEYHSLSMMTAGDYFGEIGALTGARRTADVVAEESSTLLQQPAAALRMLMAQPAFSQMVLGRMSERLTRTSLRDLPRFAGIDQQDARELREEQPDAGRVEASPAAGPAG